MSALVMMATSTAAEWRRQFREVFLKEFFHLAYAPKEVLAPIHELDAVHS